MSWASALRKTPAVPPPPEFFIPQFPIERIDWPRLVSLDFETFYDDQYTLSKLSTSEYIRDPRFEALMVGVKVGRRPRKVIPGPKIGAELAKVDWKTHSLLCHNTHFDGLILSHHYKIVPRRYYCSLSMARGLHSNEIGAGLDEVAVFYGRAGKLKGTLEQMKGRRYKDLVREGLYDQAAEYCGVDVDEMLGIFEEMARKMPVDEMDLIDLTCRMFCDPVLLVDIPRVQAELERERDKRRKMFTTLLRPEKFEHVLKGKEKLLEGDERTELITKRVIGSNEQFADLLRVEGIEPPVKISPAWMKKSREERTDAGKYTYAFAKTDLDFIGLPNNEELIRGKLDPATAEGVMRISSRQEYIRRLVEARLAVKSTSNISRAERFLVSGAHGMRLPVGYAYYRAHCLTGDAQVLTRLGWVALASWSGGEIAQWSEDGSVRFAEASANVFDVDETLVVARGRYHGCVYTKGHTLPALTSYDTFQTRKAGEALARRFDIPITGVLDGAADISPLEAQLAVMVQADGNVRSDSVSGYCVRFGFTKVRKIARCKDLLSQAGITFTEAWEDEVCRLRVGVEHYRRLTRLVGPYKQFDKALFDAPAITKTAFISELAHWDGDVEPQPNGFTYTTIDEYNADFVATMAHISGRAAFVSTRQRDRWSTAYRVYIRRDTKTRSTPEDYAEVEFSGKVYCPTTVTGYFMVRQNGRIVVTGNTGRWGGTNKMNMQNLARGGELRRSILAPKGSLICGTDSGQIEARVNAWLWGQDDLLNAFRAADAGTGLDAYCQFASLVYGRVITKADKDERFLGKVCVLALGYGMSAFQLMLTLARGALGGPPIILTQPECQRIVNVYRRANRQIVTGWEKCNTIIEDMARGREGSWKCISWSKEIIYLPNGMTMKYPDLKKAVNEDGWIEWAYRSGDARKKIYGAMLCENIVQALARVIVAGQMLVISRKYRVVMTTHDEVAALARVREAPKALEFMIAAMRTPPAWCTDIPLNAEGVVGPCYMK